MALRGLRKRSQERVAVLPPPAEAEPLSAFIDAGSELVGELRFEGSVRIDGRVEGEIRAARTLIVGESACVRAGIQAETVVVHGSVEGDVRVARKITLHETARVSGEIQTAGIVVEEGARFKGAILIGGDEPAVRPASSKPAPDPAAAAADSATGEPDHASAKRAGRSASA